MPRIRNRILLTTSLLLIAGMFVATLLSLQWLENARMQQLGTTLDAEARALQLQLRNAHAPSTETVVRQTANQLHTYLLVLDAHGRVTASAGPDGQPVAGIPNVPTPSLPASAQPSRHAGSIAGESALFSIVPVTANDTVVYVAAASPLASQSEALLREWCTLSVELGGLCLILIAAGYWFARRHAAPLEHIADTIGQIAAGDLNRRVPYWGQDEYGKISSAVNSLTVKLVEQMDDLSQERSKVEGIIGQMGSGVLVVDRTGVILMANRAAINILNAPYPDLVGRPHWEAVHCPELSERIDLVLLKGSPERLEVHVRKGSELHIEMFATPIVDHSGNVVGAVSVLHDVTQFRRVERMRTEFVANVSHELRTPVTAVKGFAETLLDGALDNPELSRQFVEVIYNESERLSQLVQDLLELSKIESGHSVFRFEAHDLNLLVAEVAKTLQNQAEQKGLELSVQAADGPAMAEVAEARIEQVMVNLIGNALAYTPAPGKVEVRVQNLAESVQVDVTDTGIGIPAADLPHIFERFYRVDKDRSRNTGGTGLGLSIVKHILEAHHGTISVHSEVGQGSTFSLLVPKLQPVVSAPADRAD